jgi:hypothetical protein
MKKFLLAVIEQAQPLSPKLLVTSFISGYTLAIIFFKFYGPQVHRFLDTILERL